MQRIWTILCDRHYPGFTLIANTRVAQVEGARMLNGWTAVEVLDPPHIGRVVFMRVESSSNWLNLWETCCPLKWKCSHGRSGAEPWKCEPCVMAARIVGPRWMALNLPEVEQPGPCLYFEEAVDRWGAWVGNTFARLSIDLWLAHEAGMTWDQWCEQHGRDDAGPEYVWVQTA